MIFKMDSRLKTTSQSLSGSSALGKNCAGRQGDHAQHVPRDRCLERQTRCFGCKGDAYVIQGRDSDLRAFHLCLAFMCSVLPSRLFWVQFVISFVILKYYF